MWKEERIIVVEMDLIISILLVIEWHAFKMPQ